MTVSATRIWAWLIRAIRDDRWALLVMFAPLATIAWMADSWVLLSIPATAFLAGLLFAPRRVGFVWAAGFLYVFVSLAVWQLFNDPAPSLDGQEESMWEVIPFYVIFGGLGILLPIWVGKQARAAWGEMVRQGRRPSPMG